MGLSVSASVTDLLLQCQRPFAPDTEIEKDVGDAANYGSAFAELVADALTGADKKRQYGPEAVAEKWDIAKEAEALEAHAVRAVVFLKKWIAGDNPLKTKLKIVLAETPMATYLGPKGEVVTWEAKLDLETHTYDLDENEIGGTPDLLLKSADGKIHLVIDHKSGQDRDLSEAEFANPSTMGQLRTLGLMTSATHVGVFFSPRGRAQDDLYVDPISAKELAEHHAALRTAMARIGDGYLRPGKQCRYCDARPSCPANYGEMVTATAKSVTAMTKLNLGSLSESVDRGVFTHTWRNLEKMAKIARDMIKEEVREGARWEEPDGKVLTLTEVKRESLSMTSIREALGKPAGDAEIERLRKLGAVKEVIFEELRAK
jgi:Protein of unknown function (DUF2800)